MTIVPDTKDWTWVLDRTCPECGFDVQTFPRESTGGLIRENASRWQELMADPRAGTRPSADVWSALEYGCHVRDVFLLYDERLELMISQDDPLFANWDQDATAVETRYAEQNPATVAAALTNAAEALAARFDSVVGDQWERTGNRSDGARFTVESFARYLIHDPYHHIWDVERGYERIG